MESLDAFNNRIDNVLGEERQKIAEFQHRQVDLYHERQQRLQQYEQEVRELIPVIAPRLRALAERFRDKMHVQPIVREHTREIECHFKSEIASVSLKLSAYPDHEARNIVFEYNLRIVPLLFKFDSNLTMRQPLENVDRAAVIKWFDDRIVDFIKTYISIYENDHYLKGHQVIDPVAGVSFPKHFAAAKLDWQGQTHYFLSLETLAQFENEHGVPADEGAASGRNE